MPDFLGVVVGADLGRWQIQPEGPDGLVNFGSGGPDSQLLVGPAELELTDGTRLDVPGHTPGGNMCQVLGWRESPYEASCVVVGELDEHGAVGWFGVEQVAHHSGTGVTLDVDRFEGRSAVVRVGPVLVSVPIRYDARLDCTEPGDLKTTPVDVPSTAAVVELTEIFEAARVECIYPTD